MQKVHLFNSQGESVAQVSVPAAPSPDIVMWRNMPFHLQNGRYIFATVYMAESKED